MTAFYMFRLVYLTFFSEPRMSHDVEHHIHESPKSMTVPLVVLAFFSITAGWLGWPASLGGSNRFEKFLEPVFAQESAAVEAPQPVKEEHRGWEYGLMGLSIAAAICGWGLASRYYSQANKNYVEPLDQSAPPIYDALLHKYYVDEGIRLCLYRAAQDRRSAPGRDGFRRRRVLVRFARDRWHGERRGLDHPVERKDFQLVG